MSTGSGAGASTIATTLRSTDSSSRSLENVSSGTVPRVDAILASSSAASLYYRAMWLSSRPWNMSSSLRTSLLQASIFGF